MLTNTLNTNEVRNAAGTEVEFGTLSSDARTHVWAQIAETYALQHRITLAHAETGVGLKRVRRSLLRVDKSVISGVDSSTIVTPSSYLVTSIPVGALTSQAEVANVIAELLSLAATLGTSTLLYDGTGNGAAALLSGAIP